jgi:hypothetical protein
MNHKRIKSLWWKAYAVLVSRTKKPAPLREYVREAWKNESDPEKSLIYYEYTLHHRLRSVWARINGLNHLLHVTDCVDEKEKIKTLLDENLKEMDNAITDISNKLSVRKRNHSA